MEIRKYYRTWLLWLSCSHYHYSDDKNDCYRKYGKKGNKQKDKVRDESIENKAKIVSFILSSHKEAILGNVIIVSETKIRVRRIK